MKPKRNKSGQFVKGGRKRGSAAARKMSHASRRRAKTVGGPRVAQASLPFEPPAPRRTNRLSRALKRGKRTRAWSEAKSDMAARAKPKKKAKKKAAAASMKRAKPRARKYTGTPRRERTPSGKRAGKRRTPYRVRRYDHPGYSVSPYSVRGHWANPGVPEALMNIARGVGGALLAAGAIYGTGKILQKAALDKTKMTAALAGAGVLAGAALSFVSPGASAAVATPLFATAIAVYTGGIAPSGASTRAAGGGTATRDLVTQMGEIRRLGPGGIRRANIGEIVQRPASRPARRMSVVDSIAARA
jgi:hypothetical protein